MTGGNGFCTGGDVSGGGGFWVAEELCVCVCEELWDSGGEGGGEDI